MMSTLPPSVSFLTFAGIFLEPGADTFRLHAGCLDRLTGNVLDGGTDPDNRGNAGRILPWGERTGHRLTVLGD